MFLKNFTRVICFVFMFSILGRAAEIKEDFECMYGRAIAFRNEKAEESLYQAEALFLQLSDIEHPKRAQARHNYASIQYKKGNYKLAYEYFLRAGLEASLKNCEEIRSQGLLKQNLYLVVGSDRGGTIEGCESYKNIAHIIHGSDVDTSPLRIFGKNATTMDVKPSSLEGARHIIGDALTSDLSKKYNVKHVFMERFPTSSQAALEGRASMLENYAGACIRQISKAMKPGAVLEYEWDPFLESLGSEREILNAVRKNPFTGFVDFNEIFQGVLTLHEHRDATEGMPGKIREQLIFFNQQGLGKDVHQLIEKLYWEVDILQQLFSAGSTVYIAYEFEKTSSEDHVAEFIQAAQLAEFGKLSNQNKKEKSEENKIYDVSTFIVRTYLNFIMVHMAAENNAPYVEIYLKSIGFTDVSIERKTNIHSGRKNVWMIHAVKA